MKIGIWWAITDEPWGGGNSFLRALRDELVRQGHSVSSRPSREIDVLLLNAWNLGPGKYNSPRRVAEVKARGSASRIGRFLPQSVWRPWGRKGPAMVHRVDGVAELVRGTKGPADPVQFSINGLCDWTVFQSHYIRDTFAEFGVTPQNFSIVYNGVEPGVFFPTKTPSPVNTLRLVASSWSPNPRKGFEWMARISEVPGVEMLFAGQWAENIPPRKVNLLGPKRREELAEILRSANGFVHAALNEPSSNSIVEAMASGLPVIYLDSGSNREQAERYGVELREDVDATIAEFRERSDELRERLAADHDKFLISSATERYLRAFNDAIRVRNS